MGSQRAAMKVASMVEMKVVQRVVWWAGNLVECLVAEMAAYLAVMWVAEMAGMKVAYLVYSKAEQKVGYLVA